MKKYFILSYLLLFRYKLYQHFFNLIFLNLKNIFTFYKIKKRESYENDKSKQKCLNNFLTNSQFYQNYSQKKINFESFEARLNLHKIKFSKSYDNKGPANLELLYFCSKLISAKQLLETGVADGWSTFAFLIHLDEQKSGNLTSIDLPYLNSLNEYNCGVVVEENLRTYWNLISKPDNYGISQLLKSSSKFDLIHYDSDKSIYGRNKNYPKLWKMLNKGGIFISDDISDNMSFFNFCDDIGKKPSVVKFKNKFQGIILK